MFPPKRFDKIWTERSYLRPLLTIVAILAVGVLVKLNEAWLASVSPRFCSLLVGNVGTLLVDRRLGDFRLWPPLTGHAAGCV